VTAPIHGFSARTLDGQEKSLGDYAGKVLLVVNTASQCGLTPHYKGLQELHESYADRGLAILGFPCNQFGFQEPGTSDEIATFCQRNYGVQFQMFEKVDVNGAAAHPLFKFLQEEKPGILGSEPLKWNFTKFLVDREGNVVERYAPTTDPAALKERIEQLLG
jgi:glutathione peroxidase